MWTTRRCYPASSCVSLHNIIFHSTPQCAALWLLSHNDTFTRCEPVQGRDGFDNLRKQTLEGEGRRQQEKRRSNASGSTSCSSPEPGQRLRLRPGGGAAVWWGSHRGPVVVNVFPALPGRGGVSSSHVNFTRPLQTALRWEIMLCQRALGLLFSYTGGAHSVWWP